MTHKTPLYNPEEELIFSRFEAMVEKYPNKTALVFLGEKFSYSRLKNLIDRLGTSLSNLGVKKGDRVILYLSNCPQWIISFFGIIKIGAVVVPVSPIYTSHELTYMIQDSEAQTIICHDTNFGYVKEILLTTGLKQAVVTNIADLLSLGKRAIGFLFDKIPHGLVDKDKAVHPFKSLLKNSPALPPVTINPRDDLAYILYTGGTTGFPKGVPGNHMGMTSYVNDLTGDVLQGYIREGEDVYIAINPLFHIMALGFFVAAGLNNGNTTILMPQPQVDPILEAIQKYQARWMLGVPTLYRMMLENDRFDQYNLKSLRYCYCGGDVLPLEVFNRWKEKVGVPIYQVYGATEVGHITYSRLNKEPDPRSIGLPLPSRICKVVNPETLEPVPFGETGELMVTSEYTVKQYWKKPEETARSYIQMDGRIYYRMGDFVSQNEAGELFYMERLADIIKYKGYRVSASEIEAVLQDHPTVVGACVVGVPDPKVGERIKGIVVLKSDAKGVGANELIRLCRERLAPYKVPQYIEFRDMLPKSKVGKLLRREIRDEEMRKLEKKK
ncbi:MAG TPA: AMP-binding protein [Thermodesulfobacteriota bacterium]|nr:AMP-binding protein [Thermodesulfobacteriota bacterium]